jgi:hypothetical protein
MEGSVGLRNFILDHSRKLKVFVKLTNEKSEMTQKEHSNLRITKKD